MDSSDTTRAAPQPSRFYEAVFANTAADAGDTLLVFIPSISLDLPFGDPDGVIWSPVGGALPQEGDRALVAESNDGSWWVVSWWADTQSTGVAPAAITSLQAADTALGARVGTLESRPRVTRGTASCAFTGLTASGVATVAHGLGGVPASVTFGAFDLNVDGIALTGVDSTNLQIQARYVSAVTGTATIMWIAAL